MKTVADLKCNEQAIIKKINASGPIKSRIMEMGLLKGSEISVVKVAPLGDPIQISIRGCQLTLRKSEAKLIEV